jgi:hypothetical protein
MASDARHYVPLGQAVDIAVAVARKDLTSISKSPARMKPAACCKPCSK